jgi:predicted phage terminase large subunit-like protein
MSAAADILRRRLVARSSLPEFARVVGFEPALHHRFLCEKLEAVERGEIKKLAFFLPPGASKSTYCQLFSLWYMSKAQRSVLCASNVTELAERFSRRVRGWAEQHGSTLGVQLDATTQSAGYWALTNGSTYLCAGVNSSILGSRADCLICDDPLRSREESLSETARASLWDWYHSSARTRLRPGASEILVMTRFSEADLAAMLLEREDDWTVVNIPAEAEPGVVCPLGRLPHQMLWTDDDYGYGKKLEDIKKTTLPEIWSAMYQGRPTSPEGNFFKVDYFRSSAVLPPRDQLHIYGASDYAVSAGKNDFTVHLVVGLDSGSTLYIVDCWRAQAATDVSVEAFCDLVLQYKPIGWACETGQLHRAIEPYMKTRMWARNASVAIELFPTRGDKSVRCQAIRGRLALSPAVVPIGAPWWPEMREELLAFPGAGKHDDAADALGLVGQILSLMSTPHVPVPKPPRKLLSTDPALCTVSLDDMFEARERAERSKRISRRI